MFRLGQKVRYGTFRGVIIYIGMDGSWYSIRTNKGREINLIPFNCLVAR